MVELLFDGRVELFFQLLFSGPTVCCLFYGAGMNMARGFQPV
jgi:hypothetical protein